jgi:hypothetical protein
MIRPLLPNRPTGRELSQGQASGRSISWDLLLSKIVFPVKLGTTPERKICLKK